MSNASRIVKSHAEELPADIVELAAALESLPWEQRQRIEPLVGASFGQHSSPTPDSGLVQDALSQLRLDMKYLMFDLGGHASRARRTAATKRRRCESPWVDVF